MCHPEHYLFLLSNFLLIGSKYPKNKLFNFEKDFTGARSIAAVELCFDAKKAISEHARAVSEHARVVSEPCFDATKVVSEHVNNHMNTTLDCSILKNDLSR